MTDIQLVQILKQRLGEKEAESLVAFVDAKFKESNEHNLKKILATKEDIAKLDKQLSETKVEIMRWMFGIFAMLMLAVVGLYFKH